MSKLFRFLPTFKSSTHGASRSIGTVVSSTAGNIDEDQCQKNARLHKNDKIGSFQRPFSQELKIAEKQALKRRLVDFNGNLTDNPSIQYKLFQKALVSKDVFSAWDIFCGLMEKASKTQDYLKYTKSFTVDDYNAVLRILRTKPVITNRVEKIIKIEQVLLQMKKCGREANVVTYVTVMAAYSKLGDVGKVKSNLAEMETKGLRADSQENILLDAYVHDGDTNSALAYFEQLRYLRSGKLVSAYNIMMQAANALASNTHNEAHKIVKNYYYQMVSEDHLIPDRSTLDILIDSFSRVHEVSQALEIVHKKRDLNYPVTTYEYNSLLRMYDEMGEYSQVTSVFRELLRSKVRPDHSSFRFLMNAWASMRDSAAAVETFLKMPRYHVVPNSMSFSNLAKAIGRVEDPILFWNHLASLCNLCGQRLTPLFTVQLINGYFESKDTSSAYILTDIFVDKSSGKIGSGLFNQLCSLGVSYKVSPEWMLKFWPLNEYPSLSCFDSFVAVIDGALTTTQCTPNSRAFLLNLLYRLSAQMHRNGLAPDRTHYRLYEIYNSFEKQSLTRSALQSVYDLAITVLPASLESIREKYLNARRHSIHDFSLA